MQGFLQWFRVVSFGLGIALIGFVIGTLIKPPSTTVTVIVLLVGLALVLAACVRRHPTAKKGQ